MTESFALLVWRLWVDDWITAGGQDHRHQLLAWKAEIEPILGWTWDPPYRYDNPPRKGLAL